MINNKRISIAARALAIGMVAALVLAGTAMGEVSRTGLIAEYHFEGDAKDSSGYRNDGTIYGASFVEGKLGKALSLNGINDYVSVPHSMSLNPTQFTLEALVIIKGSGNDWQHIISKSTNYPGPGMTGYVLQWQSQANNVPAAYRNTFSFWTATGSSDNHIVSGTVTPNTWYHLVGTFDGTVKRFYINGALIGTSSVTVQHSNTELDIGKMPVIGNYFNGIIDEVRIYNRALSDSEVKANYEASKAPPPPQLTLTKSLSPSTITEGDSTTVTIRVENTGGDAKSVKITDSIPQGFTLVSGSASQEYAMLKATESRTFQYTIKATGTGRFVSDLATVTYQDEKSNSYSGASNSATITVQAGQAGQVPAAQPKTPGFGAILAGIGIVLALALRRR